MTSERAKITIVLGAPDGNSPNGYIGMTYTLPPLPGEDWRRGGDGPDGPWDADTWNRIDAFIRELIVVSPPFA